ncbi:MAG: DUF86 domain-containing protein [Cytophagaceae bacterium]|nr:DUF86 domain-containing protein [Cytophagaceae bacterium]
MKEDLVYLEYILESLRKILEYTNDFDRIAFLSDTKTQDACIRQFEVIGETTKRLTMGLRVQFPQVPWKDMAGMRDKLIHDYIDVDMDVVWQTTTDDVPTLLAEIETIYETLSLND